MNTRTINVIAMTFTLSACVAPNLRYPGPQSLDSVNNETTRPALNSTTREFRTPQEAAERAADPRAPTGALIILPPK